MVELYDKHSSSGLEILAVPCNQFGGQEPGTNANVEKFARAKGAKFPVMGKIEVNGAGTHPLYEYLKSAAGDGSDIGWNFAKFLVDGQTGEPVERYEPQTSPMAIEGDILKLL
mmetsp:Transcript_23716/g.69429  ORF Transcript_23716/g.69429 Transcript_23716/m.69429 type:complete len:113 (-) Transcript_23716:222-560(-)